MDLRLGRPDELVNVRAAMAAVRREDFLDRSGADWNAAGTARVFPSHTFPGCYAIAYITSDGEEVCADCLNAEGSQFHFDGADNQSGWQIVGITHSGESDSELRCCNCNKLIAEGYDQEPDESCPHCGKALGETFWRGDGLMFCDEACYRTDMATE